MPSILPLQGVLEELPLNIFARTKYSYLSLNKHWPRGESIHKSQMKETKMQGVGVKPALFTLQGYLLLFLAKNIWILLPPHVNQSPSDTIQPFGSIG